MRRHSTDLVSLVFGLVFLVVAALWPLWRFDVLDAESVTWFPATALIAIGVLGLVLSIAKARAPSQDQDTVVADPRYDVDDDVWMSDGEAARVDDEVSPPSERSS